MEALLYICKEGCITIGPRDKVLKGNREACGFEACKGLESLVRHFFACKIRVPGGCVHCKWMWQLLILVTRLHHTRELGEYHSSVQYRGLLLVRHQKLTKRIAIASRDGMQFQKKNFKGSFRNAAEMVLDCLIWQAEMQLQKKNFKGSFRGYKISICVSCFLGHLAALMGLSYRDTHLVATGSTMAANYNIDAGFVTKLVQKMKNCIYEMLGL